MSNNNESNQFRLVAINHVDYSRLTRAQQILEELNDLVDPAELKRQLRDRVFLLAVTHLIKVLSSNLSRITRTTKRALPDIIWPRLHTSLRPCRV